MGDLPRLRREYDGEPLRLADLHADPLVQLERWLQEARSASQARGAPWLEASAMALASVGPGGRPSLRMVLLRGLDARGPVFFTDLRSRKGVELAANPAAALLFHWPHQDRQVRLEGTVENVSRPDAETYFRTRPRGNQISAWVSHQSARVESRQALEDAVRARVQATEGHEIPCPPQWGGFRLSTQQAEFFQGRPSRLHDRVLYERILPQGWKRVRLQP